MASIDNLDAWQVYYDRQDRLEKLRLYFCVIGWQLLTKIFPRHRIFKIYDKIINSPDYIQQRLEKEGGLEDLSLSLSSMGKIPNYSVLGLNNGEIFDQNLFKSEPAYE